MRGNTSLEESNLTP